MKQSFRSPAIIKNFCLFLFIRISIFAFGGNTQPPNIASTCNVLYVTPSGTGSGTPTNPSSLQNALNLNSNVTLRLATGVYPISNELIVGQGVVLEGGFDPVTWQKSNSQITLINRDALNPLHNPERLVAFVVQNASGFRFQDLTINVANATGNSMSTYGIYMDNCSGYDIVRCKINIGNATGGLNGSPGLIGQNGGIGADGQAGCNDCSGNNAGGGGGTSPIGNSGGRGGFGGWHQNDFLNGFDNGETGVAGIGPGGAGGIGAVGTTDYSNGCDAPPSMDGANGSNGANGLNGTGGTPGSAWTVTGGFFVPGGFGGNATGGTNGTGGGCGGGGGGQNNDWGILGDWSDSGAGGGGGGGGASPGTGGTGASGGGASFGVFANNNGNNGNIRDCIINPGLAGAGGIGGAGGSGGIGGNGGYGIRNNCDHGNGGTGGAGGNGGNGGNGGDGQAGVSMASYYNGANYINSNVYSVAEPVIHVTNGGCTANTVSFSTTSPGTTFLWDFGANSTPSTGTTANPAPVIYSSIGFSTITLNIDGTPYYFTDFVNIINNAGIFAPVIATSDTSYCLGDTASFSSSVAADNYNWNFNGAFSPSVYNGPGFHDINNVILNSAGTYNVSLQTISACCGLSAVYNLTIHVDPVPSILVTGNTSICNGQSTTLTSSGGSSYLWSTGETTSSVTLNPTTTTSYWVRAISLHGCVGPVYDFTVSVNPAPSLNITVVGSLSFCAGGSVTLLADSGSSYLWSTGATTQDLVVSSSGVYSVSVTNSSGCLMISNPVSVTVFPLPTASISASGPTAFCQGGNVVLTSSAGTSYLWSNMMTTQSITVNSTGNFYVKVTDANGCYDISQTVSVIVDQLPSTPTITSSGPLQFCQGDSVQLSTNPSFAYLWSTGATTQSVTVYSSGNYTLQYLDSLGCSSATSVPAQVVVLPAPPMPTITQVGMLLTSNSPSSNQWNLNGIPIPNATFVTYTVLQAGNYSVTVTGVNGCSSTSLSVYVNPQGLNETVDVGSFEIFPNPAFGQTLLTLQLKNACSFQLEAYTTDAKLLFRKSIYAHSGEFQTSVDVSKWAKGIYYLRIVTPNTVIRQELAVQ